MRKFIAFLVLTSFFFAVPAIAQDDVDEVTAQELGESVAEINTATSSEVVSTTQTGTLVEIGNTTADETTVVVRVTGEDGQTEDVTVELNTDEAALTTADNTSTTMDDWIAGDGVTFQADEDTNSGNIKARKIINRTIRRHHRGANGWITAIRTDKNEVDVNRGNITYTLKLDGAKIVAGLKNPATIADLKIGDRIRARIEDDKDGNNKTWNTRILVVLRRGNTLFMRVTRWVAPGKIVLMEENPTIPTVLTMEILPNKFYEKGDVNNLVGVPGETIEVYVDENTKLRRRYMGKASIEEFSEGDTVHVIGRLNESTGQLDAKFVRNTTIQKLGVAHHIGTVTAIDTLKGEISATTVVTDRPWTIKTTSTTEIYKGEKKIALSDIQVGDKIRTRGVANRTKKVVTADRISVLVHPDAIKQSKVFDRLKDKGLLRRDDKVKTKRDLIKDKIRDLRKDLKDVRKEIRDFRKDKKDEAATETQSGGTQTPGDSSATPTTNAGDTTATGGATSSY